jgi:hypothetical protein
MARGLKLDIATGIVRVEGAPAADADDETKSAATNALIDEIGPQLEALSKSVASEPRQALLEAYRHKMALEAHPRSWISDRSRRRLINESEQKIEKIRDAAFANLEQDEGKQIWEDLPYVLDTLQLIHAKQRTEDEVKRLILTPLGKLEFSKIDYKRQSADDLSRVCQEVTDALRATTDLDDQMLAWGPGNRAAILHQRPLAVIPPGRVPGKGGPAGALLVGVGLLAGGGAALAGLIPGAPPMAGLGGLIGLGPLAFGGLKLKAASAASAALPGEFADLSARFRERLYLVCALRTLNGFLSKLTRSVEAFRSHLQANGGRARWKRVKFEGRDLTELFATETWEERGTIESWLNEKVQEQFRLDSTKMSALDDLDEEDWGILLQAFELDALDLESSTEGRLLDSVSHLLFTKRGEDTAAERADVFARVRKAWETSTLASRGAST